LINSTINNIFSSNVNGVTTKFLHQSSGSSGFWHGHSARTSALQMPINDDRLTGLL